MRVGIWILLSVMLLVSCGKTQPQYPRFCGEASSDSMVVQMLTLNQQLASQADLQLASVATKEFVLMDENYWVKGLCSVENQQITLQEGEYVNFEAQFYSLTDSLITTHQASAKLGQLEEIQAIIQVLPLMQRGMHVTLLVPWYMAFGSVGNQDVPPYENLRVELSIQ